MLSLFFGTFATLRFLTAGEEISYSLSVPLDSGLLVTFDFGLLKLLVIGFSCSFSSFWVGSSLYNFLIAGRVGEDSEGFELSLLEDLSKIT